MNVVIFCVLIINVYNVSGITSVEKAIEQMIVANDLMELCNVLKKGRLGTICNMFCLSISGCSSIRF